jgi:hypothetical protein
MTEPSSADVQVFRDVNIRQVYGGFIVSVVSRTIKNGRDTIAAHSDEHVAATSEDAIGIASDWLDAE